MGLTATDYRQQLQQLLPQGLAWPREPQAVLTQLLEALAVELARVDGYLVDLVDELLPDSTTQLLTEWETITGLPGACSDEVRETPQARRLDILSKLAASGGASRAYFIQIAATYGISVSITEYRPFRAGISHAGDPLTNGYWPFTWRVLVPGLSAADGSRAVLECLFNAIKPAHTIVIFDYSKPALLRTASGAVLGQAGGDILSVAASIQL